MDKIISWFGKSTLSDRMTQILSFWNGTGRYMVTVNSSRQAYRQVFDTKKIVEMAVLNLEHQATLPGCNIPAFFADFGTVSTAKYWGGHTHFDSTGKNIFIDPAVQTVSEACALVPKPIDEKGMDAVLAVGLYKEVCSQLETDNLWLRMPDLQGTFNTAALIINQEELLMAPYAEPENLVVLLDKVSDLIIDYYQFFKDQTNNHVCGFIWPYTFFPCTLGISMTEDMMPLLPADIYREFATPYLKKLSDRFGGLHIHCCGEWGRHAQAHKESGARIKAVEFHYPFTTIEELSCLAPETVFIPYIMLDKQDKFSSTTHYYEWLLSTCSPEYRFWFAFPEDTDEAIAFAQKHTR